jgi:hypothetical protein
MACCSHCKCLACTHVVDILFVFVGSRCTKGIRGGQGAELMAASQRGTPQERNASGSSAHAMLVPLQPAITHSLGKPQLHFALFQVYSPSSQKGVGQSHTGFAHVGAVRNQMPNQRQHVHTSVDTTLHKQQHDPSKSAGRPSPFQHANPSSHGVRACTPSQHTAWLVQRNTTTKPIA